MKRRMEGELGHREEIDKLDDLRRFKKGQPVHLLDLPSEASFRSEKARTHQTNRLGFIDLRYVSHGLPR
jgi:hypothetical protein